MGALIADVEAEGRQEKGDRRRQERRGDNCGGGGDRERRGDRCGGGGGTMNVEVEEAKGREREGCRREEEGSTEGPHVGVTMCDEGDGGDPNHSGTSTLK